MRCFGLVVLLALAACEKPNLEATEGGYRGRSLARVSRPSADTAMPAAAETTGPSTPADTAFPAAPDTATP